MTLKHQIGQLVLSTSFGGPAAEATPKQDPIVVIFGNNPYAEASTSETPSLQTTVGTENVGSDPTFSKSGECIKSLEEEAALIRMLKANPCHPREKIISVGPGPNDVPKWNPITLTCERN